MNFIDVTGQNFGALTVVRRHGDGLPVRWICRCSCGNETVVQSYDLRRGHTKSCGCLRAAAGNERRQNLTGRTFGRWTVIREAADRSRADAGQRRYWLCQCSCGAEREIRGENLVSGQSKSCGCLRVDVSGQLTLTHGNSRRGLRTREYRAWRNAKTRCFNTKSRDYHNYGGRGITMCHGWQNDFGAFFADMGCCPKGHTLDRIDVNGNYEPGNCRWAPQSVQARNRRNNHVVNVCGVTLVMTDWARQLGVTPQKMSRLLLSGKSPSAILRDVRSFGEAVPSARSAL